MENIYTAIFFAIAISTVQSGRITSALFGKPQNKISSGHDSRGKNFIGTPGEFINISMMTRPVVSVPIGSKLELECEAIGSPPPSIKWYNSKNLLSDTGFPEQNEVINTAMGKVRSRLVIDCIMPYHQGIYTCSGTSGSKTKIPSSVTVLTEENTDIANLSCKRNAPKPPRIVTWSPTILEVANRDITLPCSTVGNPMPEIYWINNRNQIIDSESISSHYKISENGELIITQISWEDMGTYTCIAQNSVGQDKTESFVYPMKSQD